MGKSVSTNVARFGTIYDITSGQKCTWNYEEREHFWRNLRLVIILTHKYKIESDRVRARACVCVCKYYAQYKPYTKPA